MFAVTSDNRVLKIYTSDNSYGFVGNNTNPDSNTSELGWQEDAMMLGIDGCICWPPKYPGRTLKYDPHTDQISMVGYEFGRGRSKWSSGALTSDGAIYCFPSCANQVLAIDPIGEFLATTKSVIQDHQEEFGSFFQTFEADEDSEEDSMLSLTNFDLAVVKFGHCTVFEVLENAMKPVHDYCKSLPIYDCSILQREPRVHNSSFASPRFFLGAE